MVSGGTRPPAPCSVSSCKLRPGLSPSDREFLVGGTGLLPQDAGAQPRAAQRAGGGTYRVHGSRVTVNDAGTCSSPYRPQTTVTAPSRWCAPELLRDATSAVAHSRRSIDATNASPAVLAQAAAQTICRLAPRAACSGTRCPSRPSRPPVPASPSQPWVPPLGPELPSATAASAGFLGLADWPNSGRRRCRHFRHPRQKGSREAAILGP